MSMFAVNIVSLYTVSIYAYVSCAYMSMFAESMYSNSAILMYVRMFKCCNSCWWLDRQKALHTTFLYVELMNPSGTHVCPSQTTTTTTGGGSSSNSSIGISVGGGNSNSSQ